jgi:predicted lactoylglutathione lyase
MPADAATLARTVMAMRPMVPAKDFEISKRFYIELGFEPNPLTDRLIEMQLGAFSFILQAHYAKQWADNLVMHLRVSDVKLWWDHINALDLTSRYGVKAQAPQTEDWGLVFGVTDPSGVLWRVAEAPAAHLLLQSTITCPHCAVSRTETMPTDACQFFYECTGCGTKLKPKAGDCCVFCSYGSIPCPPIQAVRSGLPGTSSCCA